MYFIYVHRIYLKHNINLIFLINDNNFNDNIHDNKNCYI